jgi:hypothetical protein
MMLETACLLHNFRVAHLGGSQINTVFAEHFEACVRDGRVIVLPVN